MPAEPYFARADDGSERFCIHHPAAAPLRGLVLHDEAPAAAEVVKAAMQEGLLLVPAGPRVVRFVPPLVIRPRHIRQAVQRLEQALANLA